MVAPDKDAGLPQPCEAVAMDPVTECLLRHTGRGRIRAWFMLDGREVTVTFDDVRDAAFEVLEKYRARAG